MMRRVLLVSALALAAGVCAPPLSDPLLIEGNRLTVANQTPDDWTDIEVWLNRYYRVKVRRLAAGRRVVIPLDSFVDGYGRRFARDRQIVSDLRLTAKGPDGAPVEVVKEFERSGLDRLRRGET